MRNDRRRYERIPFCTSVSIYWYAGSEMVELPGKCVDMSAYGMLVDVRTHIPDGAQVSVEVSEFAYSGTAIVVRSFRRGNRVRIGLQFGTFLPFYLDTKRQLDAARSATRSRPETSSVSMWDPLKLTQAAATLVCFAIGHDLELVKECVDQVAFTCCRCGRL
jgi:hypothetical protein